MISPPDAPSGLGLQATLDIKPIHLKTMRTKKRLKMIPMRMGDVLVDVGLGNAEAGHPRIREVG